MERANGPLDFHCGGDREGGVAPVLEAAAIAALAVEEEETQIVSENEECIATMLLLSS